MNSQEIMQASSEYIRTAEANRVQKEYAMAEDLAGTCMYAEPLFAFGAADDQLFEHLKEPEAVGPCHLSPKEWLPEAKTVLSIFLPFTDEVKQSNRQDLRIPSALWLHARIEGQKFINQFTAYLKEQLIRTGAQAVIPFQDKRYWTKAGKITGSYPGMPETDANFISNWSERHVAYVCGLGTFGLSRGLITQKGVAGRFTSIVTDAYFEPTQRAYNGLYDYCSLCGACVRRCPANAISKENGKEHPPCSGYLDEILELYKPRYACGKCQAGVPCESGIPRK